MEQFTEISNDIQTIIDIFDDKSVSEIAQEMGLTETRLLSIKNGEHTPTKEELDSIYNYAYEHRLFLNEITWQESVDEYTQGGVRAVSHGSRTNIKGNIRLDVSGESNDFADGFYIGQSLSQAAMFVGEEPDSSLYILTFNTRVLKAAAFSVSTEWMLAVAYFRDKIPEYANHPKIKEIADKVNNCDYVFAPIADNRVFETIDAFTEGLITDKQCLFALSATHLGYQYVLKTQKALSHLDIKKHLYYCPIEKAMYNKEADVESNTSMNKAIIAKKKYTDQGQYINELLDNNLSESIQGFDGYNEDEIIEDVIYHIEDMINDFELPISIKDIRLYGSRNRNTAREDSDLDVVVEYEGDFSEDSLFNLLNENPLYINNIKVDINPIQSDINDFMNRAYEYDKQWR